MPGFTDAGVIAKAPYLRKIRKLATHSENPIPQYRKAFD